MSRTKKEKQYLHSLSGIGCIVCHAFDGIHSDPEIHHIRQGQGMGQRSSDYLAIPLCPAHHRTGGTGVAIHAGQRQFEMIYGTELELLAKTIEALQ